MATDFSSIEPLKQQANQAEDRALASSAAQYTLPQKLSDAINSRFNNSQIVQQRQEAIKPVLTSAPRAREAVAGMVNSGTILSPTQQQSIIASRRAADVVPLISLNDMLSNQFGQIGSLVDAGTRGFQAQVASDQGAASLARERANSALSELIAQRELALKEQAAARANAPSPFEEILKRILLDREEGGPQSSGVISPTSGVGPQFSSPIGTIVEDDETGMRYQQTAQGWMEMEPPVEETNIFERIFGGIGSLFNRN